MKSRHPNVPLRGHAAVKALFVLMEESGVTVNQLAKEAGIYYNAMYRWKTGHGATVDNLEAALNVLGYRLVVVPLDTGEIVSDHIRSRAA